jgi:hypothetical protein
LPGAWGGVGGFDLHHVLLSTNGLDAVKRPDIDQSTSGLWWSVSPSDSRVKSPTVPGRVVEKVMTDERLGGSHSFPVNGVEIEFDSPAITGREALTRSNNEPASEFQLILVHDERTRLIGTDDEIDLREAHGGELRAFEADRSFSFTVDEVGQVWGAEDMEVSEFLRIWPPQPEHHWVLERADAPDTILTEDGVLSFCPAGVEHVVSRKVEHPDKVLVMVVTTAGVYPAEGVARYSAGTLISTVLAEAKTKLDITTVPADWVVMVDNVDINPNQSFEHSHLTGRVKIEWGPREGGGGA